MYTDRCGELLFIWNKTLITALQTARNTSHEVVLTQAGSKKILERKEELFTSEASLALQKEPDMLLKYSVKLIICVRAAS